MINIQDIIDNRLWTSQWDWHDTILEYRDNDVLVLANVIDKGIYSIIGIQRTTNEVFHFESTEKKKSFFFLVVALIERIRSPSNLLTVGEKLFTDELAWDYHRYLINDGVIEIKDPCDTRLKPGEHWELTFLLTNPTDFYNDSFLKDYENRSSIITINPEYNIKLERYI